MKEFGFFVDVFSHCNLRCPSCLIGNKYGDPGEWPRGLMSADLLGLILDKGKRECEIQWVSLYNWTEPLLHPNIVELVRVVKERDIPVLLSSNLNVLPKPEDLLSAEPNFLRISLSGFTQEVYQRGHRGGKVEAVKENLIELAAAKARTGASTHVEVFYHLYTYNLHEVEPMRMFAESLGFGFNSYLAQIYPVEKIIAIANGKASEEDRKVLDTLALPLNQALAFTAAKEFISCTLQDDQIAIDVKGNVNLCCASSMNPENSIGSFLDLPLAEIQRRRHAHSLCGSCIGAGVPGYLKSQPEFTRIAKDFLAQDSL